MATFAALVLTISGMLIASAQDCAFAAGSPCSYPHTTTPTSVEVAEDMNVLVILTDDQRVGTLQYMANVTDWLIGNGTNFVNAYAAPTSLCCPARSSFLSGGLYSYETTVLNNEEPNGGATQFYDGDTLSVRLQTGGYDTCIVGKYLNDYGALGSTYIPPGWSKAFIHATPTSGTHGYYNATVVYGSSGSDAPATGTRVVLTNSSYATDYLTNRAIECMGDFADDDAPFFVYLALNAPHAPQVPDTQDSGDFATFNYSSPATQETDFSDKPEYIQDRNPNAQQLQNTKDVYRAQLETLQSVDRNVGRLMQYLSDNDLLDNTLVVFAGDNGFEWGEHHNLGDKGKEYEESLKVPMVIRDPQTANLGARNSTELVSWTLDLPKTIANIAGIDLSHSHGHDLLPIVRGESHTVNTKMVFQAYGKDSDFEFNAFMPIYAAIRDGDWKYVELSTGEKELYNLATDPYELTSLHADSQYNTLMATLSDEIDEERGLSILTTELANATAGVPYTATISKWGGVAPFTWSMYNSTLPAGLTLNSSTGVISGTPTTADTYTFQVKVEDSSSLPLSGAKQRHIAPYTFYVN